MAPYSTLASPSATRAVLEAHGLSTKKSLGQHFLANDAIVGKILDLADIRAGDKVLEVGPGIGTLTVALLAMGAQVVAIERDPALPAVLAQTCAEWESRFTLLQMDALDLWPEYFTRLSGRSDSSGAVSVPSSAITLPAVQRSSMEEHPFIPTKFVANLPYAVAATLVLDYFERFPTLEQATVMVQAEVADRMMARPPSKDYGAYTVKLGLYAQPVGRFKVGPGNFFPPPRVDSAVVRLDRVGLDSKLPAWSSNYIAPSNPGLAVQLAALTSEERAAAAMMADAAFANRRKTLANSCKAYFAGISEISFTERAHGVARPGFIAQDAPYMSAQSAADAQNPLPQSALCTGSQVAESLPRIFKAADINPTVRGETLSREDFILLGKKLIQLCCQ